MLSFPDCCAWAASGVSGVLLVAAAIAATDTLLLLLLRRTTAVVLVWFCGLRRSLRRVGHPAIFCVAEPGGDLVRASSFRFFPSHVHFPASGQAVVPGAVIPSPSKCLKFHFASGSALRTLVEFDLS